MISRGCTLVRHSELDETFLAKLPSSNRFSPVVSPILTMNLERPADLRFTKNVEASRLNLAKTPIGTEAHLDLRFAVQQTSNIGTSKACYA